MADTLQELLKQAASFQAGSTAATKQALTVMGTQASLTNDITSTYQQQATDDAAVAAAKYASDLATQTAKLRAGNAFRVNMKENNEVITGLATNAEAAYRTKEAALNEIARKQNTSFLASPLEYIANMFTINDDVSRHNIANAQLQNTQSRIQDLNANAQTTIQTQSMLAEPLLAANADAAARLAANAANVAAKQSEIASLNYNVRGIEFALNASKEQLQVGFQTLGARNQARSMALQEENAKQSRIEFSHRQEEWAAKKADRVDQEKLAQSVIDTVNLGRKALLGPNAPPLDDMGGKMIIQTLRGKGSLSVDMQKYYETGERTRLAGKVIIGSTPAAAADTLQKLPVQLNSSQGSIKSILGQAAGDVNKAFSEIEMGGKAANPVFIGMDKKDKSSIDRAYNQRAQQILDQKAALINTNDPDNPYVIGSINQLAANSPTIQKLPLYQKVFAPLVASGVQLSDPKQIVSLVGDAVAKGKISHKEAIELTTIYHVGVLTNNAMRSFESFGLRSSLSYNARIETNPNAFTPTEIVDMTKPDSVSRALLKLQAARVQEQLMNGTRSMTPKFNEYTDDVMARGRDLVTPQPRAAAAVDKWTDNTVKDINNITDQFFNSLPTQSKPYFGTPRDKTKQEKSGKITTGNGQ